MEILRLTLHIAAVSIWVGGQIVLLGLLPALRRLGPNATKAVAQQFRLIAWPAFAVLVATGIWNVIAEGDELDQKTLGIKYTAVLASGVGVLLHERAKTARGTAIWGAVGLIATLAALVVGVMLGTH